MPQQYQQAGLEIQAERLICRGAWTVGEIAPLEAQLARQAFSSGQSLILDGAAISALDTSGALLLRKLLARLQAQGCQVRIEGLADNHADLLSRVNELETFDKQEKPGRPGPVETTGRQVMEGLEELFGFLSFTGETILRLLAVAWRPWRIRWKPVLVDLGQSGAHALGIVGLLAFLMGVVIAYQGAVQLKIYGANIYVADLVGLSMVRELAPLLTAIIVAGRTGSAYTAQIGTMQVTEEIAALRTIGIPPLDVLVLPKLISLMLALPLLAIFADIMGVLGGMVMAKLQLGLGFEPYIDRLQDAVSLRSFFIGILKAPVFAFIIVLIGCFQGFRVAGSAESVGRQTTQSVVQAIFLVILADAQFSIIFSWLGI